MSFCWATDTPVLDIWWCLLWVSKPECTDLFALGRGVHDVHSLRFTSGATPTDLLVASMTAEPSIGGAWDRDLSCHCLKTREALYRLSYAGSAKPSQILTLLSATRFHWGWISNRTSGFDQTTCRLCYDSDSNTIWSRWMAHIWRGTIRWKALNKPSRTFYVSTSVVKW